MTKSKIRFVNSYEKLLSLSIHNEEIWEKNTNYAPHKLHMLNSLTFKIHTTLLYLIQGRDYPHLKKQKYINKI